MLGKLFELVLVAFELDRTCPCGQLPRARGLFTLSETTHQPARQRSEIFRILRSQRSLLRRLELGTLQSWDAFDLGTLLPWEMGG